MSHIQMTDLQKQFLKTVAEARGVKSTPICRLNTRRGNPFYLELMAILQAEQMIRLFNAKKFTGTKNRAQEEQDTEVQRHALVMARARTDRGASFKQVEDEVTENLIHCFSLDKHSAAALAVKVATQAEKEMDGYYVDISHSTASKIMLVNPESGYCKQISVEKIRAL